jgi:hypothetical protein
MWFLSFANFTDLSKSESASVIYPLDSAIMVLRKYNLSLSKQE